MKKILIGALIVCFSLGLAGMAMGVEVSWSGSADLNISGSEGAASGVFGGDASIAVNATVSSGPWSAVVIPKFDTSEDPVAFVDDAYLKYTGEAFELTLDPTGISNGIFDIYAYGPDGAIDGAPNIASNDGLKLTVPMENFTFFVVVNNQAEDSEVFFNFGTGFSFSMDALSVDLKFNSDGYEGNTWYGSTYGVKLGYTAGALTLVGEYGAWSPGADVIGEVDVESGSGYYGELGYTLPGGSTFTLSYTNSDKNLNGATYGASDHAYSKIKGVYSYSLSEATTLSLEVASTDDGYGEEKSVTSWKAKIAISL